MADEMTDRELNDHMDDNKQVSTTSLWMNEVWSGTTSNHEIESYRSV